MSNNFPVLLARPQFWPSVMTIPMIVTAIILGFWQLERLKWKEAIIADRAAQIQLPPIHLPLEESALVGVDFRPVTVRGQYIPDQFIYLLGREAKTEKVGHYVIQAFRRVEGPIVFVNRGWVPPEKHDPKEWNVALPEGEVEIAGLARQGYIKARFTPLNDLQRNEWFYTDYGQLSAMVGQEVQKILVELTGPNDHQLLPKPNQTRTFMPNDHLQYAVTWFLTALAGLVVYIFYHRQLAQNKK